MGSPQVGSPQADSPTVNFSDPEVLVPTTHLITQECPRFRILVLGRSGVGKSSLINAIFKVKIADVQDSQAGKANINYEFTSESNERLVVHDSEGYETADMKKFNTVTNFILERSQRDSIADRIHAIWLCIAAPYAGGRVLERGDEKIFGYQNKVPIIVVFTQFDLFETAILARTKSSSATERQKSKEVARREFEEEHGRTFKALTKDIASPVPYVLVAVGQNDTLEQLVKVTMDNIHFVNTGSSTHLPELLHGVESPSNRGKRLPSSDPLSSRDVQATPSPNPPPSPTPSQGRSHQGRIARFKDIFRKTNKDKATKDSKLAVPGANLPGSLRHMDQSSNVDRNSTNNNSQPGRQSEDHDLSDIVHISFSMAQRIDPKSKIEASIRVGKKKYWTAIAAGAELLNLSLLNCLSAIHMDIVTVWNIRELSGFLLDDSFRGHMTRIVKDLSEDRKEDVGVVRNAIAAASTLAGLASAIAASAAFGPVVAIVAPVTIVAFVAAWAFGIYKKSPENIRCLMAYVVDLTLILDGIFQASLKDREGRVGKDDAQKIIDDFDKSSEKTHIHDAIRSFVNQRSTAKDDVVEKMEKLIDEGRNSMHGRMTSA